MMKIAAPEEHERRPALEDWFEIAGQCVQFTLTASKTDEFLPLLKGHRVSSVKGRYRAVEIEDERSRHHRACHCESASKCRLDFLKIKRTIGLRA